ncbi:hypothetical protein F971_00804 [Acinetobacter vivianii]|uniref:Uncharacterized protein n=1 Tax=Acinetobacter vivianii TaxID=1776742 RepID=N8V164_9GAMM|nr:hypothetical protein [Acinetobacter vivianii]ENU93546.1 hypothetical protein F971_00804 [Acinetobacter vivianii]
MRKTVNLPLYDEFMDIFANHEIRNWQAKHFWKEMVGSLNIRAEQDKRLMYAGLKILVKCDYLEVDITQSKKGIFSYKETQRLELLRKKHIKQKLERVFVEKKIEFLCQIKDKENNINFIQTLLADDQTLEKYFLEHQLRLENDIRNINSNIKFMEDVLN